MSVDAEPATVSVEVLLVEDDADDALLVRKRLPAREFAVTHVRTLDHAVAQVGVETRHACVLLDLSLPDVDGLEGLERLRRVAPCLPVVVLTGNDDEKVGLLALAAGAQDYLVKGRIGGDTVPRTVRYAMERQRAAAVLGEERQRFRRTFEDGPLAMVLVDLADEDWRILEANEALGRLLGCPAASFTGRRIAEFTHWQDRADQARAAAGLATSTVQRYSVERRLIHAAGHVVWCTITASAVRNEESDASYAIALIDDITDRKVQQQALEEAHLALDTAVLGIALFGVSGRYRMVNAYYAELLGYEPHELVGAMWDAGVHPHDEPLMRDAIGRVLRGEQATVELRGVRKDGTPFDKEVVVVPNAHADGSIQGYYHFVRDVTERRRILQALEESEARYRRIIETSNDGVWLSDAQGQTTFVNDRLAQMLGWEADELIGRPFDEFVHGDDQDKARAALGRRLEGGAAGRIDLRFVHRDGTVVWFMLSVSQLVDGTEARGLLAMVTDVTDRKLAEAALRRSTLTDALTGLPNRALLHDRLGHAVRRAHRDDCWVGVLFVDIDRFKATNDAYGHDAGDELLRAIAPRLEASVRATDTVARYGGDEFVVLCADLDDDLETVSVADRLLAALKEPFQMSVGTITTNASVGIATQRGTLAAADDLLRDADVAMYRAKERGGGRVEVFDVSMRERVLEDMYLERELRRALAVGSDGLALEYQPIVRLPEEHVVGFEALLRWTHPERGAISPADIIPVAERTGLIVELGTWILREACEQLARWASEGHSGWGRLAINVSPRQVDDPGFVECVSGILADTGIAPQHIDLEITETALFSGDPGHTVRTLRALTEMGVGVVLDDFGTGYSSLSYLSRFPLTAMKLDRSFISGLDTEASARPIVEAVIAMAQSLGMPLVAEGVESIEQVALLAALGCDHAQGFLYAPAMPAAEVPGWATLTTQHLGDHKRLLSAEATGAWMSLGDAANALGVSASTLRRWADEGRIAAQRTPGGHRRFSVADLKRLSQSPSAPRLNLGADAVDRLPEVASFLAAEGERLASRIAAHLYEGPTHGWFDSDRAKRPLRQWIEALVRACRDGSYDGAAGATTRLVGQAQIGGATLLECWLFVERYTAATGQLVRNGYPGSDERTVAAAVATVRRGVLAAG